MQEYEDHIKEKEKQEISFSYVRFFLFLAVVSK